MHKILGASVLLTLLLGTSLVVDFEPRSGEVVPDGESAAREVLLTPSEGSVFGSEETTGSVEEETTTTAEETTTTAEETTTTAEETTTTEEATTTTEEATTTTEESTATAESSDEIPATVDQGRKGLKASGGYYIILKNADTGDLWWQAPYWGEWLPYAEGAKWVAGDRAGYGCAYGFLVHNGELVGRFTFTKVDGAAYGKVNDKYMAEGVRYYDGTLAGEDDPKELGDCPDPDQDYEHYYGSGERPRVVFWSGSAVLEIRDYRNTDAHPNIKFRLTEFVTEPFTVESPCIRDLPACSGATHTVNSRATVVAYENNLPVIVVYYDAFGRGRISADLP